MPASSAAKASAVAAPMPDVPPMITTVFPRAVFGSNVMGFSDQAMGKTQSDGVTYGTTSTFTSSFGTDDGDALSRHQARASHRMQHGRLTVAHGGKTCHPAVSPQSGEAHFFAEIVSPRRQAVHSPQRYSGSTATRCPSFTDRQLPLISRTSPANSWPRMGGGTTPEIGCGARSRAVQIFVHVGTADPAARDAQTYLARPKGGTNPPLDPDVLCCVPDRV